MCVLPRWSGHGHDHLIVDISSSPLSPFFYSTCSLLMKSIPSIYNDHLLVILNNIYSTTAHVILTDTSTLPLRFSSLRMSLDMHNSVRIRSLAIDLHIGSYHGATSSSFCQVLQESRGKFNTLSNAFFFFYSRHQLRPIAIY